MADAVERGNAPAPSHAQVALWLGISPERSRQIEVEALPRVGNALRDAAAEIGYGERPVPPRVRDAGTRRAREARVLAQLGRSPRSMAEIAQATGLGWRAVRLAVDRLREAGHDVRGCPQGLTLGEPLRVVLPKNAPAPPRLRTLAPSTRVLVALTGDLQNIDAIATRAGLTLGEVRVLLSDLRAEGQPIEGGPRVGYRLVRRRHDSQSPNARAERRLRAHADEEDFLQRRRRSVRRRITLFLRRKHQSLDVAVHRRRSLLAVVDDETVGVHDPDVNLALDVREARDYA